MSPSRARLDRDLIVATARDIVAEGGRAALSLRPLGARLGVTAPALYAHFDNKEAILAAVAEAEFSRLIERFEVSICGVEPPIDRIKAQSHAYVHHALENPALFEILFVFRPAWSPNLDATELPIASKAFEISAAAVEDAIAAGELGASEPLMASLTIWSAVHGVATLLIARPALGAEFEAALVDSVIDSVVAGLAATRPCPRVRLTKGDH